MRLAGKDYAKHRHGKVILYLSVVLDGNEVNCVRRNFEILFNGILVVLGTVVGVIAIAQLIVVLFAYQKLGIGNWELGKRRQVVEGEFHN